MPTSIIGLFFALVGALLVLAGAACMVVQARFEARATPVAAVVVVADTSGHRRDVSAELPDGRVATFIRPRSESHFAVGDTVVVFTDSADESVLVADTFRETWAGSVMPSLLGLVFVVVGGSAYGLTRRRT